MDIIYSEKKPKQAKRKKITRDTLKTPGAGPTLLLLESAGKISRSQMERLRHQIQLNEEATLTTQKPFLLLRMTAAKPLPDPFKARLPLNPDAPGSPTGPVGPMSPLMPRKPRTPGKPGVPVSPWSEAGPGVPRGPGGPGKPRDNRVNWQNLFLGQGKFWSYPQHFFLCGERHWSLSLSKAVRC